MIVVDSNDDSTIFEMYIQLFLDHHNDHFDQENTEIEERNEKMFKFSKSNQKKKKKITE